VTSRAPRRKARFEYCRHVTLFGRPHREGRRRKERLAAGRVVRTGPGGGIQREPIERGTQRLVVSRIISGPSLRPADVRSSNAVFDARTLLRSCEAGLDFQ